eukprot:8114490-Pyramimonas_sp.AAC.1
MNRCTDAKTQCITQVAALGLSKDGSCAASLGLPRPLLLYLTANRVTSACEPCDPTRSPGAPYITCALFCSGALRPTSLILTSALRTDIAAPYGGAASKLHIEHSWSRGSPRTRAAHRGAPDHPPVRAG